MLWAMVLLLAAGPWRQSPTTDSLSLQRHQ